MWYRVFCRTETELQPTALLELLQQPGRPVTGHFRGDDLGWTSAELTVGIGSPVDVQRYLSREDDLRDDLNTWAGWLETQDHEPNHAQLMEHVIQTKQLVVIRKPLDHANESAVEDLCRTVCMELAKSADGVFQIEGDGWYDATGQLLLREY
ncbi:MAG TPA: hypothetical protein VHR66_21165 [Gemmataceae bacterium]|jgi:hypothetical protein|nr:hypothetical protein [Gemmataceae bacterium]